MALTSTTTATPQPNGRRRIPADSNKLSRDDRPAHEWYRFVLSYPPHLVRDYLQRLNKPTQQRVLDPFCGSASTIVDCKKLRIESVGIEPHPVALFARSIQVT